MSMYLKLFLSFLQIGALSFGGGYGAMPLIREQVVVLHHWLTISEFTDLVTIAEMTPGPIAVNAATFVGTRMGGLPGALAATAGCIFPSAVFVTVLARIYLKYRSMHLLQGVLGALRPAVVALIACAGTTILTSAFFVSGAMSFTAGNVSVRAVLYFILALVLLRRVHMSPVKVMVLCGVLEVLWIMTGF